MPPHCKCKPHAVTWRPAHEQAGVTGFSSLRQLQSLRLYEIGRLDDDSLAPAISDLTRCAAPLQTSTFADIWLLSPINQQARIRWLAVGAG